MSSPRQGAVRVKTPKTRELETQAKIKRIRVRLEEVAEYKRVLAVDGLKPDVDDKRLESELIVRLLYLEKELKNMAPEALAMKAREREEEAARNATVAAGALKRRGPRDLKPVFEAKPIPADAAKKPFKPRSEPWRNPYASDSSDSAVSAHSRKNSGRPGAKPAAARSDKRPSPGAKPAAARSDKRPSPHAKSSDRRAETRGPSAKPAAARSDKRPSPYAKSSDSRAETRRPSPYAKKPAGKRYAKPDPATRDESSAQTSPGEKKGYWSRDDRRVRPGKRPAGRSAPKR